MAKHIHNLKHKMSKCTLLGLAIGVQHSTSCRNSLECWLIIKPCQDARKSLGNNCKN